MLQSNIFDLFAVFGSVIIVMNEEDNIANKKILFFFYFCVNFCTYRLSYAPKTLFCFAQT